MVTTLLLVPTGNFDLTDIYHATAHSAEFFVFVHDLVDVDDVVPGSQSQEVAIGRELDNLDGLTAVL